MIPPVLAGIDAGHPRSGPETIHVDVTNSCNADCLPCWDHSPLLRTPRPASWKALRMDPAVLEGLLDDALRLGGLRRLILSGMGEPLTHPAIDAMIGLVKARRLRLTLISNLMADRAADAAALAGRGVDEALVSVHAASQAAYRAVHPCFPAGAWPELLRRLRALAEAGCACKHVHVICAPNAEELPAMVELGKRLGASEVSFKLASLGGGTEACRIDAAQRRRLRDRTVPAAREAAERIGMRNNLALFARQLEAAGSSDDGEAATVPIRGTGCFVGYAYARVTVEGTVLYCCDPGVVVGSLGDAPFSQLWPSAAWDGLRARLREGRYFPGCARCGKFAQNEKLGRLFAEAYGTARRDAVIGLAGRAGGDP